MKHNDITEDIKEIMEMWGVENREGFDRSFIDDLVSYIAKVIVIVKKEGKCQQKIIKVDKGGVDVKNKLS